MSANHKPETFKFNIDSTDQKVIDEQVLFIGTLFSLIYNCTAVVTEVVTVGEDGKLYIGYEIEKKSPAANN